MTPQPGFKPGSLQQCFRHRGVVFAIIVIFRNNFFTSFWEGEINRCLLALKIIKLFINNCLSTI